MKPFWCFYGGKWRGAKRYPKPKFDLIIEPFAGAAGYSTRYYDKQIILIDKDPVIAGLWDMLISSDPDEILGLPDIEFGQDIRDMDLSPPHRSLIGFWLNKGVVLPCNTPSAWMKSKDGSVKHPGCWWGEEIKLRVWEQMQQIRHWTISCGDYNTAPDIEATWFIDPPYDHNSGRCYKYDEINYDDLAEFCLTRKGQIIVCEREGADWLPFEYLYEMITTPSYTEGKKRKRLREVIWTETFC